MKAIHNRLGVAAFAAMALLATTMLGPATAPADPQPGDAKSRPAADLAASKEALAEFNSLIGGWRGVGQPKRASNQGAWKETANWVWDFSDKDSVAIRYQISESKLVDLAVLTYDTAGKNYKLSATFNDKSRRVYQGRLKGKKLILESEPDQNGDVYRMTVTRLNDKRTLVLHEKRRARQKYYSRIAEIGYTRQGTRLASSDQTGPICIVTGGAGTSKITYKGKTYYVCCSGCREAFLDDPEGILAEARKKAQTKRKKAEAPNGSP